MSGGFASTTVPVNVTFAGENSAPFAGVVIVISGGVVSRVSETDSGPLLPALADDVAEDIQRIVGENCQTLKFKSHGFGRS